MTRLYCGLLFYLVLLGFSGGCPVAISPSTLVVRYGGPASSTCRSLVPIDGMGWESPVGAVGMEEGVTELNWTMKELREWTVTPQCFINKKDGEQCTKELSVLAFKMPDSVALVEDDSGPKYVNKSYSFACHIKNFAPVKNLTVKWFKGEKLLKETTLHEDHEGQEGPQNRTVKMESVFSPPDDGSEYRCEAGLDFTPDLPIQSQPVLMAVHYPPDHNHPEIEVLVLEGDTKLNCTVNGNPPPDYAWTLSGAQEKIENKPVLAVKQAGDYICTASNKLGSSNKHFKVQSRSSGTFWTIIIVGVVVAVLLIVSYGVWKWKAGTNSII
ncbi:intercellular adhesion molecule 1-like [Alosa pseudoharengus]|uniref:intercellular adhesion molecule 1-like n=1 Tax=Alosa pseudoharengus TaxID=34774 RepID=UPI003F8A1CFE